TQLLPPHGLLRLEGRRASMRDISWEGALDRPGLVDIVGTLDGDEGLTVRRQVLVAPANMVYLVNAGGAETSDYLDLRATAGGRRLKNSIADQPYGEDPGSGSSWGYE